MLVILEVVSSVGPCLTHKVCTYRSYTQLKSTAVLGKLAISSAISLTK